MMRCVARTVFVDGVTDPRLADYRTLTDVSLRRRIEPEQGIFIAEGELVIGRALRAGYPMRSALLSQRWLPSMVGEGEIANLIAQVDAPLYIGSEELLESVTGFHVHRGALAAMGRLAPITVSDLLQRLPTCARIVVLEDVNSHTNLGAIFRCAAGLGMDAVLLSPSCTDPLYRRSVRVSMGEVFAIPYARFEPHAGSDGWHAGLRDLTDAGFHTIALTPDPAAESIDELDDLRDVDRLALLVGAEGPGLSDSVMAAATRSVRIPMRNGVDSLNVAAAAAVAFYAIGRRP
jgi:tRNA G18 (ribose-2'-O)-methylase SpoU